MRFWTLLRLVAPLILLVIPLVIPLDNNTYEAQHDTPRALHTRGSFPIKRG